MSYVSLLLFLNPNISSGLPFWSFENLLYVSESSSVVSGSSVSADLADSSLTSSGSSVVAVSSASSLSTFSSLFSSEISSESSTLDSDLSLLASLL